MRHSVSFWTCIVILFGTKPTLIAHALLASVPFHLLLHTNRTVDLKVKEEFWAFYWYWELGIGRIVGGDGWKEKNRHYTTISKAPFPKDPKKELVDVSAEAFLVLLWDNCFDKWHHGLAYCKEQDVVIKRPPQKRTKANKHHLMFQAKWTTQDGGQKKNKSGWSKAGLDRYNELHLMIFKAKHGDLSEKVLQEYQKKKQSPPIKEEWMQVEETMLAAIRKLRGLTKASAAEERMEQAANAVPVPVQKPTKIRAFLF